MKGNPGGPGRGNRRGPALAAQPGTPRRDPSSEPIAHGEPEDRLELAERKLELATSELALANGRLARAGVVWSVTLAVLQQYPDARRAVLAALWPMEEAERAAPAGQASPDAGTARPGGDAVAGESADVPLPEGKRRHRPIPDSWGGTIETGGPRRGGAGGIGDPYGDGGPLDSRD